MRNAIKTRSDAIRLLAAFLTVLLLAACLPLPGVSGASVVASGYCNASKISIVMWSLSSDGVLTIGGSGPMRDYDSSSPGYQQYADQITRVVIDPGVTYISQNAFYDPLSGVEATFPNLKGDLTIPDTVIEIGASAFKNCRFNGTLSLGGGLQIIGNAAFQNCAGFKGDLVIPDSVLSIGIPYGVRNFSSENAAAFANCTGFSGLTLGGSVEQIGSASFRNCTGLTGDLTIPDSVSRIGTSAFEGCAGLNGNLKLGRGVSYIGSAAFLNCFNLNGELKLPAGLSVLGGAAFKNCYKLSGRLRLPAGIRPAGLSVTSPDVFHNTARDTDMGVFFADYTYVINDASEIKNPELVPDAYLMIVVESDLVPATETQAASVLRTYYCNMGSGSSCGPEPVLSRTETLRAAAEAEPEPAPAPAEPAYTPPQNAVPAALAAAETRRLMNAGPDEAEDGTAAETEGAQAAPKSNCPCGKYHDGPFASVILFFHGIIPFIKSLFS